MRRERAEIAALALVSTAVKQVAAALEAINIAMIEQNKLTREGLGEARASPTATSVRSSS